MNKNEPTIKVAEFLPVLDSLIGLVGEVLTARDADQEKIAQLTQDLAGKDRVILEKVASPAPRPMFNEADIDTTLGKLQVMNVIDGGMALKIAADIKEDPHAILGLLTKISEAAIRQGVSTEGEGIGKEATSYGNDGSDPDGWDKVGQEARRHHRS